MTHEIQGDLFRFSNRFALATVMAISVALVACGGGGGGGAGTAGIASAVKSLVSMTGIAADAPIASATITITATAPLNVAGAQTIGTVTAGVNGAFLASVTLPTSSVPVFANAAAPNNSSVILTSYLGQAPTLAAAGTLTATNTPNLDITPVTTAALAVYAQLNGGSYAGISPSTYATTLQNYGSDILAIAAAIKAVGDNLCAPAIAVGSTTSLAAQIAQAANLTTGTSTTISTAATILGGNCPAVLASLPQMLFSDPLFGPQLYIGEVNDVPLNSSASGASSAVIAAGTYSLQGVFADTNATAGSAVVAFNPAAVFTDAAVTIDASGNVTSSDRNVTGAINGNLITLSVLNGAATYSLTGKVGAIQTALTSGGTAYAVQAGGSNTPSGALTAFEAVMAPANVTPVWNGVASPTAATTLHNVTCAAGAFPIRLNFYGQGVGGVSFGDCITASATNWTLTSANSPVNFGYPYSSTAIINFTTPTWSELSAQQPFILSAANTVLTINGAATTGTVYYVMGTSSAIFSTTSANVLVNIETSGSSTGGSLTLQGGYGTITGSSSGANGANPSGSTTIGAASGVNGNGQNSSTGTTTQSNTDNDSDGH
jgi:hypothetical protein